MKILRHAETGSLSEDGKRIIREIRIMFLDDDGKKYVSVQRIKIVKIGNPAVKQIR